MSKASVFSVFIATAILSMTGLHEPVWAQSDVTDNLQNSVPFPNPSEAFNKPDISKLSRLRFITDNDYPPFNYLDDSGNLVGFNVELARAICAELNVSCSVQALSWERMINAIDQNVADAIIASLAITKKNRRRVAFSRQYYRTPAQFVTRKNSDLKKMIPETLQDKRVGVAKGTSHEAYLKAFFSASKITSFDTAGGARKALMENKIDAVFDDGVSLMFWLNGEASNDCCKYSGGSFTESKFFGEGVGIAVKRDNRELQKILNYGLDLVEKSGKYHQIFKRFFPQSFY